MIYNVQFKPKSIKDAQTIPKKDLKGIFEKIEFMKTDLRGNVNLMNSEFIKIKNELEDYEDLKLLRQAKRKEADSPTLSMDEAKAHLLTKRVVKQLKKRG